MTTKRNGSGDELVFRNVTLQNDSGGDLSFRGRLTAESSHYDEWCGILTKEKIYLTDDGRTAYSIAMSDGETKDRRAYLIEASSSGDCIVNDGKLTMLMPQDILLTMLSMAFESAPDTEEETLEALRRKLDAANG
ncbi:MAG: hypothetical protein PWQ57_2710 [Desulfovibrionales bacterium]|jgi:hypothetical protein|nr:hypothetical protein [Desulfovibrionales bacterium]